MKNILVAIVFIVSIVIVLKLSPPFRSIDNILWEAREKNLYDYEKTEPLEYMFYIKNK